MKSKHVKVNIIYKICSHLKTKVKIRNKSSPYFKETLFFDVVKAAVAYAQL
jgi:hypothetical protein